MGEITLKEFLLDCSKEELCERLMKLESSMIALHKSGFFIGDFDPNHIKLYNGELTPDSINGKIGQTSNSYNVGAEQQNILEMCAIGICAYNGFSMFFTNREFIFKLITEFDSYCKNGKIPEEVLEYYEDVLINGNIDYLNNFLYKKANQSADNVQVMGNSYQKSKNTAIGRALNSDREAAYVSVLILPALMVLIYFVMLVILYFVDK